MCRSGGHPAVHGAGGDPAEAVRVRGGHVGGGGPALRPPGGLPPLQRNPGAPLRPHLQRHLSRELWVGGGGGGANARI